jgi:hypothetical protein
MRGGLIGITRAFLHQKAIFCGCTYNGGGGDEEERNIRRNVAKSGSAEDDEVRSTAKSCLAGRVRSRPAEAAGITAWPRVRQFLDDGVRLAEWRVPGGGFGFAPAPEGVWQRWTSGAVHEQMGMGLVIPCRDDRTCAVSRRRQDISGRWSGALFPVYMRGILGAMARV